MTASHSPDLSGQLESTNEILARFRDMRILVVGDFMLDEYVHGVVDRISPEAPVPVVLEQQVNSIPGGAGNVVRNLISLGARVYLAGVVGADETGRHLRASLADLGLTGAHIGFVEIPGRPSTRKTRILAARQQVCRLDRESREPVPEAARKQLLEYVERVAPEVQAVIISDYDKGVVTPDVIARIVELAAQHNCFVAVDPQVTHFHFYERVDVLTPNHHEAGRFLKTVLNSDEEVRRGGFEILNRLQAKMLLITRGENGIMLFRAGEESAENFPTNAREVFDVTGAGDTVISVFTLAAAAGASPEAAVKLSNRAAGRVVAQLGAATVTIEELQE